MKNETLLLLVLAIAQLSCSHGQKIPSRGPDTGHPDRLDVHGHRGARARYPENTLPAFEYAIKVGADYLEMDMAVTKDDHIVISHDPHITGSICLAPGGKKIKKEPLIHDLTLAQVKEYDCGTIRNSKFPTQTPVPGTRIPTLDEVFEMVKNSELSQAKKVQFNIETKIFPDHPEYTVGVERFVELALQSFRNSGMMDRIVLQSFDYRTLREARKHAPELRLSALSESFFEDLVDTARTLKPDFISPYFKLLNKRKVQNIQALGVKLAPWTVNDSDDWERIVGYGVEAIITDDPEGLLDYLRKRQTH